ncbi:hypothetical protein [Microbacterium hominis]|uniref:Uncharacterized protein n=1 Tax=Microbacterium hominis TaxID=162426 RepID=A0A7D4THL6_9MICO|nr:hypothetical protein [Microbacterium hominis]QKJ20980.1 hypothetical protein HQM25_17490 [Microbacterium hominis]
MTQNPPSARARANARAAATVFVLIGLLFSLVLTPLGLIAGLNARPAPLDGSGSNPFDLFAMGVFAVAAVAMVGFGIAGALLGRKGGSRVLFVLGLVATALLATGAIGIIYGAIVRVSY